jgi:PIN domain nuclease of toxin-antitoxin system
MILLDTHVLVWAVEEDANLREGVAEAIRVHEVRRDVLVSAVSFWEIGVLVAKDRLRLSQPLKAWTDTVLSLPGFTFVSLTPQVAIESSLLPPDLHADPADRLLVATARSLDAILVTHDGRIIRYGSGGHVKVMIA